MRALNLLLIYLLSPIFVFCSKGQNTKVWADGYYFVANAQSCLHCKSSIIEIISSENNPVKKLILSGIRGKDIPSYLVKEFGEKDSKKIQAAPISNFPIRENFTYPHLCLLKSGQLVYAKEVGIAHTIWDLIDSVTLDESVFKIPIGSGVKWQSNAIYFLNAIENDIGKFDKLTGDFLSSFKRSNPFDSLLEAIITICVGDSLGKISNHIIFTSPLDRSSLFELSNFTFSPKKIWISGVISFPLISDQKDTFRTNSNFILACNDSFHVLQIFSVAPFQVNDKYYFSDRYSAGSAFFSLNDSTLIDNLIEASGIMDSLYAPYFGYIRLIKNHAELIKVCTIPKPFKEGKYAYGFSSNSVVKVDSSFITFFQSLPFELRLNDCLETDLFSRMSDFNNSPEKSKFIYQKENTRSFSPSYDPISGYLSVITRTNGHFKYHRKNMNFPHKPVEVFNFDEPLKGVSYYHQEYNHYWTISLQNEQWVIHHGEIRFLE